MRQLPLEARTVRALGDAALAWTPEMHMLASVIDLLAGANWQRSGGKGTRPKPIPRPGSRAPGTSEHHGTPLSAVELHQRLGRD